jgi:hypothetical protein
VARCCIIFTTSDLISSAGILPTQGQGVLSYVGSVARYCNNFTISDSVRRTYSGPGGAELCGTAAGFFSGEILQTGQDIPARPDLRFSVDQEVILSPIPLSTS